MDQIGLIGQDQGKARAYLPMKVNQTCLIPSQYHKSHSHAIDYFTLTTIYSHSPSLHRPMRWSSQRPPPCTTLPRPHRRLRRPSTSAKTANRKHSPISPLRLSATSSSPLPIPSPESAEEFQTTTPRRLSPAPSAQTTTAPWKPQSSTRPRGASRPSSLLL
jgi:hypothetical protein